jgi:peroxiredoxin (alkyl hydroperoxide reductase subunit C)
MTMQFFAPRGPMNEPLKLPTAYRRTVRWLPQIGDIFPDFSVETTQGPISLWDWADGSWVHLFSHPAAFTPVCTTELASFASFDQEWKRANVKLLGLTGSSVASQIRWHDEIEALFDLPITFPNAHDKGMHLARLFGMIHDHESLDWPIRKSFILDPVMRVQMIFEYPTFVGRNTEEILRVINALQMRAATGAATPADWQKGDMTIVPDTMTDGDALRVFGNEPRTLTPYLKVVDQRPRERPVTRAPADS